MSNDLISLSLTDFIFNNYESIDTMDAIKMLTQKGGEFEYNNSTNLIIGIALLVIAGVIYIGENNFKVTNGNINYVNCNKTNCTLGVEYQVNNNIYNKEYNLNVSYVNYPNNQVVITYESLNPNNSYVGTSNYNTIIYLLVGGGLFFLGLWYYFCTKRGSDSSFFGEDLNIYTKTETPSGLYVVSKK